MANIYLKAEDMIGNTPLVRLKKTEEKVELTATLLAKVESVNPGGSAKDRVAKTMLDEAQKSGKLQFGDTLIIPTSGNTGIGLAVMAAQRGYRLVVTMPDSMTPERRKLMAAYGAEVVLTEGAKGMQGAIDEADRLADKMPRSYVVRQFDDESNVKAHYTTTGPEIWRDTDGKVDIFVCGVGTGGTVTGVGRYLKEQNPAVKVVAVEPFASAVLSGRRAGAHGLQGIGAGFVPAILDTEVYDEVIAVTEDEAYAAARALAKDEGLLVGITSGAALFAAIQVSKREENAGKTIVVLLPDGGERYLSSPLYEN